MQPGYVAASRFVLLRTEKNTVNKIRVHLLKP
ncbi:MAG: hypothetical protein V7606_826 [Burkholderiales bacterium]